MLPPRISRKSDKAERGRRSPAHRAWHPFARIHADPDNIVRFNAWVGSWGDCWLWDGSLDEKGYGHFCFDGTRISSHRAAYQLFKGPICGGLHVLHRCDVRNCVNPDHLTLGTHLDNMKDMVAKGRHVAPRGEKAPSAKLTASQVLEIRKTTEPAWVIAPQYGVSKSLIWAIRRGRVWKHV